MKTLFKNSVYLRLNGENLTVKSGKNDVSIALRSLYQVQHDVQNVIGSLSIMIYGMLIMTEERSKYDESVNQNSISVKIDHQSCNFVRWIPRSATTLQQSRQSQ